jgi:hypothetical protein
MLFLSLVSLLIALVCFWVSLVSTATVLAGFFQLLGWALLLGFGILFLAAAPRAQV